MRKIIYALGAAAMVCLLCGAAALAEDNPGGGGRPQFDPAQWRQRMLDRLKETLGSTDDEWKALGPKVEAVQKLVFQARMGGRSMFGRRRGGDNANAEQQPQQPPPANDVEARSQELQKLLDNKDADVKAVKDKLKELRDAREKSKVDLKKAQDELRELLTPRQEAQLVLMGMLE